MNEPSLPTIGILGAGAMGTVFGARLAEAGATPLLVDINPAVVERINADGVVLRLEDRSVPVRATTDPGGEPPVDVLLVFVKCFATEAALTLAAPLIGDRTAVLTLQNGWGNGDRIAAAVPPAGRVFVGVTYHSATLVGPGVVDHTAVGRTYLGPHAGGSMDRAESLRALFEQAGLEAVTTDDVATLVWSKLMLNASANPVAALTGLRARALGEVPDVLALIEDVAREVIAVGRAKGYEIDADAGLAEIRRVLAAAGPTTMSSMRQDVEAGRQTEVDVMTGAVLRAAEETGVDAPLNRVIQALINGYEASRAQA